MSFQVARDEASAPYFDAAADGQLVVRQCAVCAQLFPPAQVECPGGHALTNCRGSARNGPRPGGEGRHCREASVRRRVLGGYGVIGIRHGPERIG